jgi:hypothetical protein
MMEARIFVVIRTTPDGLRLCLTPTEPDFPSAGVVAALRMTGAIDGPTEIVLPGASVLPQD